MAEEVRVDPAVLHGVAGGMDMIIEDLSTAVKAMEEGSAGFRSRLPGWALGAVVGDIAAGIWHEDGRASHDRWGLYAGGLRKCARDYEVTDHANDDNFRNG